MIEKSTPDKEFALASRADELVEYTIWICGKKPDEKKLRFPKYVYDNYVNRLVSEAMDIQKAIVLGNETRDRGLRMRYQERAIGHCVLLNHLTRIAFDKGWISDKQREDWQGRIYWIKTRVYNWKQKTK